MSFSYSRIIFLYLLLIWCKGRNNLPILGVLCMYFCMRNKIFFKKMGRMLADSKKSRTFASLLKRSTSERKSWRDGRVVDRGGLENRCTERYRGFESLSLRQVEVVNHKICNLLFFMNFSFIRLFLS